MNIMFEYELPETADVVIIGGGIVGCAIARELSKYKVNTVVLEKHPDVGWGTTKANLGMVHAFVTPVKSLKGQLCLEGNKMYEQLAKELDFPFKRVGLLLVALDWADYLFMVVVYLWAKMHHLEVKWIGKKKLMELEPNINKKAKGALLFPTAGVTSPVEATIAMAENAIENGVKIVVDTEVTDIIEQDGKVTKVVTNKGEIRTKFVINAAGVFADKIARMVGVDDFRIIPRPGAMIVFDKKLEGFYNHCIVRIPRKRDPRTKGGGAAVSVDGNPIWGPNIREADDPEDTSVTSADLEIVLNKYMPLFENFPARKNIISYFAGVRAASDTDDFIIGPTKVKGFINVAGIQSPGLTAAPAIAKMVVDILKNEGLALVPKENFNPYRRGITRASKLSYEEWDRLIKTNPQYGHIVCRCEQVTEAEIQEAIRRGATTLDGIKFRTRVGMGRCQGGFCTHFVLKILHQLKEIPMTQITKKGDASHLLCCGTKELRQEMIHS